MVQALSVPERRVCKVLGQNRATHRYAAKPRNDELPSTARIIELATTYGRYGYRTVTGLSGRAMSESERRVWQFCASALQQCLHGVAGLFGPDRRVDSTSDQ
ncbi:MAG: hypothetical protein KF724_04135 [Phycisphaeraceae bacterium]|nr:hypothetical protein [Phycisphaeraceae bacterium]